VPLLPSAIGRRPEAVEPDQERHDLLQITKLYTVFDVKDDEAVAIAASASSRPRNLPVGNKARTPFRVCADGRCCVGGRSLRTNLHTRQKWKVPQIRRWKIAPELDVKKQKKFTVVIERDEDGYYLASVPGLRVVTLRPKPSIP